MLRHKIRNGLLIAAIILLVIICLFGDIYSIVISREFIFTITSGMMLFAAIVSGIGMYNVGDEYG